MQRAMRASLLALLISIVTIPSCAMQRPRVMPSADGVVTQSGRMKAPAASSHDQFIRGAVRFPQRFSDDDVLVQVYPTDGAGKVWVMDVTAGGFTYFILATMANIPRDDGTYVTEPHFYDGELKWVAIGR